jgi:hypothetical protein
MTAILALAAALAAGVFGKSWLMGILVGAGVLNGPYLGLVMGYTYARRIQGNALDFQGAVFWGWAIGVGLTGAAFLLWLRLLTHNRSAAIVAGVILLVAEALLTWRLHKEAPAF